MPEFLFKELTYKIIGAYFDVYNGTSRTYPEFVYEKALLYDLRRAGVRCKRQEEYQVFYKKWLVGRQRLDLFIADEIIVEIKVAEQLTPRHKAQTFSYLKAFNKQVGLLFNFGRSTPEFERLYFQPRLPESTGEAVEQAITDLPPNLIAADLVYKIVGGLFALHNILGPGFIHRIYTAACYRELQARGLPVQLQKEIQVIYRSRSVASIKFKHLRIGNEVLVFPVAVKDINAIRFNNIKAWLHVQQLPLAILANFYDFELKPVILKRWQ